MKTNKTNLYKNTFIVGAVMIMIIVCSAFSSKEKKKTEDKPYYCVVIGWEQSSSVKGQPVISNVASFDCRFYFDVHVSNELQTFYQAYYAKNRGTIALELMTVYHFETSDGAVRKRRELVAEYNNNWTPLLINDFTITCDD